MISNSNTVLVVDDDPFQCALIAMQLNSLGWNNVLIAGNGAEALTQFSQHQPRIQLIISDLSMPDMDGLELMRHLAERGFCGGFIVLSGMQNEILSGAAELATAHGLDVLGCLSKPCEIAKLQPLLEKVVV
jgi:CheY-like chemotaxis protein